MIKIGSILMILATIVSVTDVNVDNRKGYVSHFFDIETRNGPKRFSFGTREEAEKERKRVEKALEAFLETGQKPVKPEKA